MRIASKNILVLGVAVIASSGFPNPAVADTVANKEAYRRTNQEAWSQGQLAVIDEVVAPDYVYHEPALGDIPGPEGLKQTIMGYRAAYPDLQFTIEDMIAEGDLVAMRWTAAGTQDGPLMDIPATGLKTTTVGINIARFEAGRIVEEWSSWDVMGLMQQLGVVAPPRPEPEDYQWNRASDIGGAPGDPMENKLLVLRVKSQFWNGKDIAGLDDTHHANAFGHDPIFSGDQSYEAYRDACLMYQLAFPDMHVAVDAIFADGDRVVVRWTSTGTHQGALMGVPASGQQVTYTGITIYRLADGKVAETWWAYDALGVTQQITTPPEWTPEGTWIVTAPSPMGTLTMVHVMYPLDGSGTRYGGVLWQVNANPTFFGTFPEFTGGSQFWATESRRIAPNTYETGMIVYSTQPVEGLLDQVASIGIVTGTWTITGPDTNEGQSTLSTYLAAQDADGDGLPDEGQEPLACTPFPFSSKRAKILPACIPTPMP